MTLAERRLNQSILRNKILKELNFILKNYDSLLKESMHDYEDSFKLIQSLILAVNEKSFKINIVEEIFQKLKISKYDIEEATKNYDPKAINPPDYKDNIPLEIIWAARDVVKYADQYLEKTTKSKFTDDEGNILKGNECIEYRVALQISKKYPVAYYQLDSMTLKLEYVVWLWNNDRFHFSTLLADFASIFDGTGILDIGQGIALICNGEYAAGIITLLMGVGQLALAIATDGLSVPIIGASKAALKVTKNAAKAASKVASKAGIEGAAKAGTEAAAKAATAKITREAMEKEAAERLVSSVSLRGATLVETLKASRQPAMQESAKILEKAVQRAESIEVSKITEKNARQIIEEVLGSEIPKAVNLQKIITNAERQTVLNAWKKNFVNLLKFQPREIVKEYLKTPWITKLLTGSIQATAFGINVASQTAASEVERIKEKEAKKVVTDLRQINKQKYYNFCRTDKSESAQSVCNNFEFNDETTYFNSKNVPFPNNGGRLNLKVDVQNELDVLSVARLIGKAIEAIEKINKMK